jgi:hypothetical protein
VTICDDREGVEETTSRAADWVGERLASLIESGPDVMVGEVTVDHARMGVAT